MSAAPVAIERRRAPRRGPSLCAEVRRPAHATVPPRYCLLHERVLAGLDSVRVDDLRAQAQREGAAALIQRIATLLT